MEQGSPECVRTGPFAGRDGWRSRSRAASRNGFASGDENTVSKLDFETTSLACGLSVGGRLP